MDFLKRFSRARVFLGENTRYVVVTFFCVIVLWYAFFVSGEGKKAGTSKSAPQSQEQTAQIPDLDYAAQSKSYSGVFSSQAGEVYRVIIQAEASKETDILVSARSADGKELEIGSLNLPKETSAFREAVFVTDGVYRDIVVKLPQKEGEEKTQWNDTSVHIEKVFVTRLNVSALTQARALKPTVFGTSQSVISYLPASRDVSREDGFAFAKKRIGQYFKADASSLSDVRFFANVIGTGGEGIYELEVGKCKTDVMDCAIGDVEMVSKIPFTASDMERYQTDKKNLYRFDIFVPLERGDVYYVGINAANAKTDQKNYLELKQFEEGGVSKGSFIAISTILSADMGSAGGAGQLLSRAMIQDIGDAYWYEYHMSGTKEDLIDVESSFGKVKFDKVSGALTMPRNRDASMTFKMDMFYPFESIQVKAAGSDTKDDQFALEYSFDQEEWKELPYVQQENGPQVFDTNIAATPGGEKTVFLRARSTQDGSKSKNWGLKDLSLSALLKK